MTSSSNKVLYPVWIALCLLSACSSKTSNLSVQVVFSPPSLAAAAERVEIYMVDHCDVAAPGQRPQSAALSAVVNKDGTVSGLGAVPAGSYAVLALAIDTSCNVVAVAACSQINVDKSTDTTLSVTMIEHSGTQCPPSAQCSEGVCTPTSDGGVDATVDAGLDAGMDAGMDAGPDGGTMYMATLVYQQPTGLTVSLEGAQIGSPFRPTLEFDSSVDPNVVVQEVHWYIVDPGVGTTASTLYRDDDIFAAYNITYTGNLALNVTFNGADSPESTNAGKNNTFRLDSGINYDIVARAFYIAGGDQEFRATVGIQ